MTILRHSRRSFLKAAASAWGAAYFASRLPRSVRAAAPAGLYLQGLRDKIDETTSANVFQENRSFDHYFGADELLGGPRRQVCPTPKGKSDARFNGLQFPWPAGLRLPAGAHRLLGVFLTQLSRQQAGSS